MGALLADKGFRQLPAAGTISSSERSPPSSDQKANRKAPPPGDFARYRWRHLVENFFCDLNQSRGVATRYDQTDESFQARIYLRAEHLALR